MPACPKWFQQLTKIISELRETQIQFFDRQAIEKLFGVQHRRALQILNQFAGKEGLKQVGNALAISREQLLANLEAFANGEEVAKNREERHRAAEELEQVKAIQAARQIRVPGEGEGSERPVSALPSTITLQPGKLEVSFWGQQDLWAQLKQLGHFAARDPYAFDELVDPPEKPQ